MMTHAEYPESTLFARLSRVLLAPVMLMCLLSAPHATSQGIISYFNVQNALDSGQATVTHTPFDIGNVNDIFDFNESSLARTNGAQPDANPAFVTLEFTSPRSFVEFEAMVGGNDSNITIESADTLSDLNAKAGSYRLLVPTTEIPNEVVRVFAPTSMPSARVFRLTVERLRSDDYVHIREWRMSAEAQIASIAVVPDEFEIVVGQSIQLELQALDASGSPISGAELNPNWFLQIPNAGIVNLSPSGLVTGVSAGQANILVSAAGNFAVSTATVQSGDVTDLNVTYIQRNPQYAFDAPKNKPAPGDNVTFTAHVKQWGGRELSGVGYRWLIDGQEVEAGTFSNIPPQSEVTQTLNWTWEDERHEVTFIIDPADEIDEEEEANNEVSVYTDALLVGFWVEQSMYDYFQDRQRDLGVGSNSWDDWAQRHISWWNELNENAVWPEWPDGILDRVALNKIVIVPDGALPLAGGLPTNHPDFRDRTVDMLWGFVSDQLNSTFYENTTSVSELNPFYKERSLIHELGHARYLIDHYSFDVFNNAFQGGYDSVLIQENGQNVAGSALMPFIAFNSYVYYNQTGGIMTGPFGFEWSPFEVGAWNRIAGQRARCGNYNASCNLGEYVPEVPQQNIMRLVDEQSRPLVGADVRVYQAERYTGGGQIYTKVYDDMPDLFFTTDCTGAVDLGSSPWGNPIQRSISFTNGVAILRIEHAGKLWYEFFEVSYANLEYMLGNTQSATYLRPLEGATGVEVPSDYNADGIGDVTDLEELLADLQALSFFADINGDGSVDVLDAVELQSRLAEYDPDC